MNQPDTHSLSLIFDSMTDGVVGFGADGRVLFSNPGMGMILGCPVDHLIGKTATEAWGEDDSENLAHRSGTITEQEIVRVDGTVRTVTAKTFTLFRPEPLHVVIYRDVTRLRRRERLLHAIFESIASVSGDEFFAILVRELAVALRVRHAFVAEFVGRDRCRVMAFWSDGAEAPAFKYDITHSPCQKFPEEDVVFLRRNAMREYPGDGLLNKLKAEYFLACALRDSAGNLLGFIAVLNEETKPDTGDTKPLLRLFAARAGSELERIRSENALRESEARLSAIVETAADAIITVTEDGLVESANRAAAGMFACEKSSLIGRSIEMLITGLCDEGGKSVLPKLAAGTSVQEVTCTRPDGQTFPGELAASTIQTDGRNVFVLLFRDISERKRTEFALVESEKRFRSLVENLPSIAVQGYDRQGKIFFWNKASENIFGYTKEEALGCSLAELLPTINTSTAIERNLREWAKTGRKLPAEEVEVIRRDGTSVHLFTNHESLRGMDGCLEFYRIDLDVTALRRTERAFRESEIRYRQLVELSPQAMAVLVSGKFVFLNRAALELLAGKNVDDVLGKDLLEFVHPADREKVVEVMYFVEAARHSELVRNVDKYIEERLITLEGKVVEVEAASIPISFEGKPAVQLIARNITEKKQAERALRESEERYALAAKGANDGLWDWNITTDEVYFSPRWLDMLGLEDGDIGRSPKEWLDRIHPDDLEEFQSKLQSHLTGITAHFESEVRLLHKDDSWRWMMCRGLAIFDKQGNPHRIAGSVRDITSRKETEQQLIHDALHDTLTGLANRGLFVEHLQRAIARSKRGEDLFAVLFLDFDRFKVVNDSLGHMVGDQLLIAVSRRLEKILRPGDLFARLGGDEFGILLEDITSPNEAKRVSERIQESLKHPFHLDGHEIFTSVSIGIAFNTERYNKAGDLLRDADTAMYRAKALGKARHVVFDQRMRERVQGQLEMETDLRRALERKEFEIDYQPIVSLETERLHGFEALVRWNHPRRGRISPAEFIPLAEETGLIVQLGFHVLRESCVRIRDWQDAFKSDPQLFVSVNISARQLIHPDLVEEISKVLSQTRVNPNCLKLELTESILLEHPEFSLQVLQQLRDLGLRICIDDFGTGYSSLSYLHRLPANTLKIDRSFVSGLDQGTQQSQLVPTIINLAQILGMDVIAEGVESPNQYQILKGLGCDYAQGYLISRPLSAAKATEQIQRNLSMFSSSTHRRL